MAIQVLTSGGEQRKPGLTPKTGYTIIGGTPAMLDAADSTGQTIMPSQGSSNCIGLALETTSTFTDPTVDYDNRARGGLVSYVCGAGNEVLIWDDGRGCPFDATQTYIVGQKLYAGTTGLVTNQVNGDAIGIVTKVPTSATDTMKLLLRI